MIVNNKEQAMATLQMHNLNFDFDKALEALNISEKDKENYFVILSISSISQKAFGEERSTRVAKTTITIGHGVFKNNFSNQTKKYSNGSKKFSIASPYSLVKFLKLSSIPFLKSLKSALPILGKSVNRLNVTSLKEMGH